MPFTASNCDTQVHFYLFSVNLVLMKSILTVHLDTEMKLQKCIQKMRWSATITTVMGLAIGVVFVKDIPDPVRKLIDFVLNNTPSANGVQMQLSQCRLFLRLVHLIMFL